MHGCEGKEGGKKGREGGGEGLHLSYSKALVFLIIHLVYYTILKHRR